jgi:hypothetical protein
VIPLWWVIVECECVIPPCVFWKERSTLGLSCLAYPLQGLLEDDHPHWRVRARSDKHCAWDAKKKKEKEEGCNDVQIID